MNSHVLIVELQLYCEIKILELKYHLILSYCMSYRINDSQRRRLRAGLGTRPSVF
jgi:hypothetical protein